LGAELVPLAALAGDLVIVDVRGALGLRPKDPLGTARHVVQLLALAFELLALLPGGLPLGLLLLGLTVASFFELKVGLSERKGAAGNAHPQRNRGGPGRH